MTKPGHEAPLRDNINPADMKPHTNEQQLRLGQVASEPEPVMQPDPPGLRLTEKQAIRVKKLMDTEGLDRGTAVLRTASSAQARNIIGHHHASGMAAKLGDRIAQREEKEKISPVSEARMLELLRNPPAPGTSETEKTA